MIEKFFTTEQVANILQVHPFTILKLIKSGKLQGIKLGRVYRIKESDVKEFLDASSSKNKRRQPDVSPELEVKIKEDQQVKFQEDNKNNDDNQHYYII